ncbi:hypothetical protein SKAU_G00288830 [Synaphobranchus kaupii]|uniref:SH3 domain-containing protein n=1 Tax=Synaphobranchus kaupii TaxID=118154 RepID=A0A9Q1ETE3_SYNKA|nr:hypothetical protein SKAU_G00288830 [Synaphobranchus kaupii]
MSLSTVLAKALFDNVAESPEELGFRKGDILMVLEQEGSGPGWWVCSLHGRQGIAPANRLRLLNTSTTPSPASSTEPTSSLYLSPSSCPAPCPAPNADTAPSVYLSPRPSAEDSVYLSPPSLGGPGRGDGRPRARSSSASRPRQDWDVGVTGRARSPSLRGRGSDAGVPKPQTLYQTPQTPVLAPMQPLPRAGPCADAVYLAPSGLPRPVPGDTNAYLGAGHSEGCYLVPRASTVPSEDVYQTPTGCVAIIGPTHTPSTGRPASELSCPTARMNPALPPSINGVPLGQENTGLYQTPSQRGGAPKKPQNEHELPAETAPLSLRHAPSPRPQPKGVSSSPAQLVPATPPNTRAKLAQASVRGSPLLPRTGLGRAQASPNFTRKPPPPAPPVRGVTKKDTPTSTPSPVGPRGGAKEGEGPRGSEVSSKEERQKDGRMEEEKKKKSKKKVEEEGEYEEPDDENINNQVYDTPPTSRWQHTTSPAVCVDDSIYNTPRAHPANTDQGSEVYDVPTLPFTMTSDLQQQTYSIPASLAVGVEVEEDVYSVPSLPGSAPHPCDAQLLPQEPQEGAEPDCGVYDMPAPPASVRRSSVSSTSSGDVQWRCSLSILIQSALSSASLASPLSRELAASLTEILLIWKASQEADTPPLALLQAWSHLSDLLPALTACGPAPPSEALLALVCRALEDSLLQIQATPSRPRLPSQDSLSRRPLPALPVAEVKPLNVGMGGRKGSWIQERPLPPPPPPSFPLPPAPPTLIPTSGQGEEEELGNEYAGIVLTTAPPPFNGGDSVGYVKLQASPSPPLPVALSLEDSELLSFYSSQSLSHLSCLADSIDALFTSVQGNQPPRVFVSRGKSLIVTAHKLVFIGDTLSRLLTSPDLRTKVTTAGGRLCQALKAVVVATKGAAQSYPSVPATQEMVDRVAELSQHAAGFSGLLQRLAEIS